MTSKQQNFRIFNAVGEKSPDFQWSLERKVRNSEPLYRVCGHVISGLERKSPDFRHIGGEKVWISAVLEGKKSGFPMLRKRKSPDFRWLFYGKKSGIPNPSIGGVHIFSGITHFEPSLSSEIPDIDVSPSQFLNDIPSPLNSRLQHTRIK